MVKLIPHFLRCPADVLFIPGYIAFAYYHSLLKLYALFTFYVTAWGGRNLAAVGNEAETESVSSADEVPDNDGSTAEYGLARPPSTEDISSYASSSSWSRSSSPRSTSSHSSIRTPWGQVRRNDPIYQPANVLESQSPMLLPWKKGKSSSSLRWSDTDSMSTSMSIPSGSSPRSLNYGHSIREEERSFPSSPDLATLAAAAAETTVLSSESSTSSWSWNESSSKGSVHPESSAASSVVEYPNWGTAVYQAPFTESLDSGSGSSIVSTANVCVGRQLQRELNTHIVATSMIKAAPKPRVRVRLESPSRNWTRGVDCGRQHDGECMLDYRGRCQIGNVRDVLWAGR